MGYLRLCISLFFAASVHAGLVDGDSGAVSPARSTITGYGFYQGGQIILGASNSGQNIQPIDHIWMQNTVFGLEYKSSLNDRMQFVLSGEGCIAFSYLINEELADFAGADTRQPKYEFKLMESFGRYAFITGEKYPLNISVGYFKYKYNPQARNLGEYLFRSRCYPTTVETLFDYPYERLLGFRLNSGLFTVFEQDLMLTSEVLRYPLQDFSLSYVASVNIADVFKLGGGIDFDRLLPVRTKYTTPEKTDNISKIDTIGFTTDDAGTTVPITKKTYYSFAGTKLMAHCTIDPKKFIPLSIFGPEDLKCYGELALLGTKNYPVYYADLKARMPITIGVNLPTFKILDVCAYEMEVFNNVYPNSIDHIMRTDGLPLPVDTTYEPEKHDQQKWSFYASKKIGGFTLIGQCARDHLRPNVFQSELKEWYDVLPLKKHWWWMIKVAYGF